MQEKINLNVCGHDYSPQIKQLLLISENDEEGVYSVYTKWPGSPELDNYLMISFNDDKSINSIDFDGGPWLTIGSKIEDYFIKEFKHDGNFNDIQVVLTKIKPSK